MAVDVLLEPAFEGVESIQAWGAVALVVTGYIAATAAWSARTLVDDRFVGDGPSPFAAVKEYGFGFAAIVAASVAADVVSSNAGTVTS